MTGGEVQRPARRTGRPESARLAQSSAICAGRAVDLTLVGTSPLQCRNIWAVSGQIVQLILPGLPLQVHLTAKGQMSAPLHTPSDKRRSPWPTINSCTVPRRAVSAWPPPGPVSAMLPLLTACRLLLLTAGLLGPALASPDEDRLRSILLSASRSSRPEGPDGGPVTVKVGLSDAFVGPKMISSRTTPISAWLTAVWTDRRLAWTDLPDSRPIHSVRMKLNSSRVWMPNIQVLDLADKTTSLFDAESEGVVSRNGEVRVVVPVRFEVKCGSDPLGLTCPFTLGSMLTSLELVDFQPISDANFTTRWDISYGNMVSTIRRSEIVQDCCSTPFAVLEVLVSLLWD